MSTHTFSTDDNPALFLEQDDGSGKPARLAAGSQVLVRNADDGTPLDSTTALDLGYLSFTTTDVQGVQVSGDNGATWKGPFWSKEARESAVKRQVNLLSSSGVLKDAIMAPVISTPGNQSHSAVQTIALAKVMDTASVHEAAWYKTDSTSDLEAIHAACAAATAAGRGNVVRLSARTWDVGNGLSMSGYSCGLIGTAAGADGSTAAASVLYASTQSGPVLDMSGWVAPGMFYGMQDIGNLSLRGSGVTDSTGANSGLHRDGTGAISSAHFFNIGITDTGGPPIDVTRAYLCSFERIICGTPVDAETNDVPYARFLGCNGNKIDIGFRSISASGDTGQTGALVINADSAHAPASNVWNLWFEYLHVADGGTLINCAGNSQTFASVYLTDVGTNSGAANTSIVTFNPPSVTADDKGGNQWLTTVPGNNVTTVGMVVNQSRNRIVGPKGFNGNNIQLNSGVQYTYAELGGAISGTGGAVGFIDNSGNATNTLLDFNRFPYDGHHATATNQAVVKTADESRSAPISLDGDLKISVAPGSYTFEAVLFYSAASADNLKVGMSTPGGTTLNALMDWPNGRGVTTANTNSAVGGSNGSKAACRIAGAFTSTTAGTIGVQWTSVSGVGAATLYAASSLRVERVTL